MGGGMEGQAQAQEQDLNRDVDRGTMADSETLKDLGRGTVVDSNTMEDLAVGQWQTVIQWRTWAVEQW